MAATLFFPFFLPNHSINLPFNTRITNACLMSGDFAQNVHKRALDASDAYARHIARLSRPFSQATFFTNKKLKSRCVCCSRQCFHGNGESIMVLENTAVGHEPAMGQPVAALTSHAPATVRPCREGDHLEQILGKAQHQHRMFAERRWRQRFHHALPAMDARREQRLPQESQWTQR